MKKTVQITLDEDELRLLSNAAADKVSEHKTRCQQYKKMDERGALEFNLVLLREYSDLEIKLHTLRVALFEDILAETL